MGGSLPFFGQEFGILGCAGHDLPVSVGAHEDLVDHLARSTPLSTSEATRVVAEIVGYFAESVPEFVRRRHAELKHRGLTNDQIFAAIGDELVARRFAALPLSARQLRRIVYG
jgi:hypothetical protein